MQTTEQAHIEFDSGDTMIYTLNNLLRDPDTFFKVLSYIRNIHVLNGIYIVSIQAIAKLLNS